MMTPTKIQLHKKAKTLDVQYGNQLFTLPAEFLRVHSPSAEVQGHGPGQAVLQHGKKHVAIDKIEAVGNYGLRIYFSDQHDSGIFTWSYLHELGQNQDAMMTTYEEALHKADLSREPDTQVVKLML
ncbi:gamma-butyrobetaine hydroxylase-like domain-containing protein [Pseudomaricurvus sp.]|uniref:gamma-butyrobetaine hydroxylase-like domain-containing protein n=1 Tax=Pseudomaricurvus sp. TaxID=2004510 RepID=UPI003F6D5577